MNLLNKIAFSILTIALLTVACKKEDWKRTVPETLTLMDKASVKYINAVLSSPNTFLYFNNTLATGAVVGYASQFPASTTYSLLNPGTSVIRIADTALVPKLSISANVILEKSKYYSLFTYDTLTTPKYKLVEDLIQVPTDTSARLRFANFIFGSIGNYDIYSSRLSKNIFTNVAATDVTAFIDHPSLKSDTFALRQTGTLVNLNTLIFTPDQKRNYTLLSRGRFGTTSGTIFRTLTFYTNF